MTYRGHKTIECILVAIILMLFCIEPVVEISLQVTLIILFVAFACLIANWIVYRRAYPQWKGYGWSMPWKPFLLVVLMLCAAVAVCLICRIHVLEPPVSTIFLFLIFLIAAAHDLYCTTKYEMDRFDSVEELFAAYPQARKRFQRELFAKDSGADQKK